VRVMKMTKAWVYWSLAFLFVVTASAVQKAQKRLKPLLRTPISSAFSQEKGVTGPNIVYPLN